MAAALLESPGGPYVMRSASVKRDPARGQSNNAKSSMMMSWCVHWSNKSAGEKGITKKSACEYHVTNVMERLGLGRSRIFTADLLEHPTDTFDDNPKVGADHIATCARLTHECTSENLMSRQTFPTVPAAPADSRVEKTCTWSTCRHHMMRREI